MDITTAGIPSEDLECDWAGAGGGAEDLEDLSITLSAGEDENGNDAFMAELHELFSCRLRVVARTERQAFDLFTARIGDDMVEFLADQKVSVSGKLSDLKPSQDDKVHTSAPKGPTLSELTNELGRAWARGDQVSGLLDRIAEKVTANDVRATRKRRNGRKQRLLTSELRSRRGRR